jgi:hypothetical protein
VVIITLQTSLSFSTHSGHRIIGSEAKIDLYSDLGRREIATLSFGSAQAVGETLEDYAVGWCKRHISHAHLVDRRYMTACEIQAYQERGFDPTELNKK